MYLLRALKALGLFNLNSYSNTDSIGVSGSIMVDNTTIVGRKVIFFIRGNCHFIFMLFVEGNIVSVVECVSRI